MADRDLVGSIREELLDHIDLLRQLVELESPSNKKALVDLLGDRLTEWFIAHHWPANRIARSSVGDILWTEWTEGEGEPILVLCHLDTVWEEGTLDRFPFRVENELVHGPGVFDMKAGVAATLQIQKYISRGWLRPRRKVRFLYTTDEEVGSFESRAVIEDFAQQSALVLVTEPPLPGGVLKTQRKGSGNYRVTAHGRAAHPGLDPEKGVNAVEEIAHQILQLNSLADPERGTTMTVTVVRGGERENVIPDSAEAVFDVRVKSLQEADRIKAAIADLRPHLPEARLEVVGEMDRPPMARTDSSRELFAAARRLALELDIRLEEGETGGGSDGCFSAALGVPTLDGLGVNGDGAHALPEHIELAQLPPRTALLARLVEGL